MLPGARVEGGHGEFMFHGNIVSMGEEEKSLRDSWWSRLCNVHEINAAEPHTLKNKFYDLCVVTILEKFPKG